VQRTSAGEAARPRQDEHEFMGGATDLKLGTSRLSAHCE